MDPWPSYFRCSCLRSSRCSSDSAADSRLGRVFWVDWNLSRCCRCDLYSAVFQGPHVRLLVGRVWGGLLRFMALGRDAVETSGIIFQQDEERQH